MSRTSKFCFFMLALSFAVWSVRAQSDTGVLRGTVQDSSGATVAKVRLTITDERTNVVAFSTLTDDSGNYIVPALKPSVYQIEAEATGFKKSIRSGIALDVNQTALVSISLEVGQVNEIVK